MHTTSYDGDIHFLHNGDYSGEVIVVVPAKTADMTLSHQDHTVSIKVPFEALEYFIAQKVKSMFIERLEDADDMNDIFGVLGFYGDAREQAAIRFVENIASLDEPKNIDVRRVARLQGIIEDAKKVLGEDRT